MDFQRQGFNKTPTLTNKTKSTTVTFCPCCLPNFELYLNSDITEEKAYRLFSHGHLDTFVS